MLGLCILWCFKMVVKFGHFFGKKIIKIKKNLLGDHPTPPLRPDSIRLFTGWLATLTARFADIVFEPVWCLKADAS